MIRLIALWLSVASTSLVSSASTHVCNCTYYFTVTNTVQYSIAPPTQYSIITCYYTVCYSTVPLLYFHNSTIVHYKIIREDIIDYRIVQAVAACGDPVCAVAYHSKITQTVC